MSAAGLRRPPALYTASALGWVALVAWMPAAHQHPVSLGSGSVGSGATSPMHHGPSTASLAAFGAGWAVMLIAMMAPLLVAPVRHIRSSSLARRRGRSVAVFLAGYGAVWAAAGAVPAAVALSPVRPATAVVIAAGVLVWQVSPAKQLCLNRMHAHPPLSAFGTAADRDALRFGTTHGGWCAASCGPLMLLPFLTPGGHLVTMAAVALWLAAERLDPPTAPGWGVRGVSSTARLIDARARVLTDRRRRSPCPRSRRIPTGWAASMEVPAQGSRRKFCCTTFSTLGDPPGADVDG